MLYQDVLTEMFTTTYTSTKKMIEAPTVVETLGDLHVLHFNLKGT